MSRASIARSPSLPRSRSASAIAGASHTRDGVAVTGASRIVFRALEGPAEIVLTDTL